jgi:uncharacterized phage protein (TIGR01671 family)
VAYINFAEEKVYLFRDRIEYDYDEVDLIQYTGLKDKNGKEIYEGDILKNKEFGIKLVGDIRDVNVTNSACYDSENYIGYSERSEIIGNKFENLELLDAN